MDLVALTKKIEEALAKAMIPAVIGFFTKLVSRGSISHQQKRWLRHSRNRRRIAKTMAEECTGIFTAIKTAMDGGFIPPSPFGGLFEVIAAGSPEKVFRLSYHPEVAEVFGTILSIKKRLDSVAEGKTRQLAAIGKTDTVFAEFHAGEDVKAGNLVFTRPGSSHAEVYA